MSCGAPRLLQVPVEPSKASWTHLCPPQVMEVIEPILSAASQIYALVENVKTNKKRCQRVSERVQALEKLVRSFKQREQGHNSADVERALRELCLTLRSAQELMKKFTSSNWLQRLLKSSSHGDDFISINERLNDAFQILSGAEQLEQGDLLFKVFELSSRQAEDKEDREKDNAELETSGWDQHLDQVSRRLSCLLIGCLFLSSSAARAAAAGHGGGHAETVQGAEGQRGHSGGQL